MNNKKTNSWGMDPIASGLFDRLTDNARKAILKSYELAGQDKANTERSIQPRHLFAALLLTKNNLAARLLEKLGIDLASTAKAVLEGSAAAKDAAQVVATADAALSFPPKLAAGMYLAPSDDYKKVLGEAFIEASSLDHVYTGCEHILLAMLKAGHLQFVKDLEEAALGYEKVKSELLSFGSYQPMGAASAAATGQMGEDSEGPTGALEFFGKSMNEIAKNKKYMPVLGREKEISRVIHILSRQTKNNPILIGESGVGKTAVIEGLVSQIVAGDVPKSLRNLEIIQIDVAAIIAGAKVRGDVEDRLMAIMNDIQKSENKAIFIDEIHTIVGAGAMGGSGDVANLLKPYLTSGDLRVIGATTTDEYRRYFEEDGALSRRFQPIKVEELDQESTLKVLELLAPRFESYHRVKITPEAMQEAVKLSARYVNDRRLPDKAIDLIDEAAAKRKIMRDGKEVVNQEFEGALVNLAERKAQALRDGDLETASKLRELESEVEQKIKKQTKVRSKVSTRYKVVPEDIREIISDWTKIPVGTLTAGDLRSIADVERVLSEQIIGQGDALTRVSAALKRSRLGLNDVKRPLASFLFLGPTGVGKTETAKVIAKQMFGKESALIQVNMSEMMEQHSISKIIGSPPGYVGYQDGGNISEQIRQKPYTVVLFDEIEKAHPELLNVLLQVLEEGYLQDSRGRKVSFRNAVVIMTSNIGAEAIASDKVLGFQVDFDAKLSAKLDDAYDHMRERVMGELKDYLRPEFINRIDEIIVYRGLNEKDMNSIAKLRIQELNQRLEDRHMLLKVSSALVDRIAKEGYSKDYGARNIRRKVQELLETNLADFLLDAGLMTEINRRKEKSAPMVLIEAQDNKGRVSFKAAK